jgi:probable addiction module antidote protein
MTTPTTTLWESAAHLTTAVDVAAYREAARQDGDPQRVVAARGAIARAKGMSQIAREAGPGREACTRPCPLRVIQNGQPYGRLSRRWVCNCMSAFRTAPRGLSTPPLEWTGHQELSAVSPQLPSLPMRGTVRAYRSFLKGAMHHVRGEQDHRPSAH